ncbi:MAG: ABC transporter permease [Kiritimatiellia bacterium]|jgi:ABC-type transport system involved in multi-copper enzyme maturation permease subunit
MPWNFNNLLVPPLLVKELRTRLRVKTAFGMALGYMGCLSAIIFMTLATSAHDESQTGWKIGANLFGIITYLQAILIIFVTPLVTASSITGEKDQKTFDSLCVAPVSMRQIVCAKLAASLILFIVLILISLPFAAASFILGGISPQALFLTYLLTLLAAAAIAAIGLFCSARYERSIASIPAAIVMILALVILCSLFESMHCTALATISPLAFLRMIKEHAAIPFYGQMLPFWLPGFIYPVVVFFMACTAAITRLTFPSERRFVLFRLLLLLFSLLSIAFIIGENTVLCAKPAEARRHIVGMLYFLTAILIVGAAWFGVNRDVFLSEIGARARDHWLMRLAARMLTDPRGFVLLLVLGSAPCVALGARTVGPMNIAPEYFWLTYFGGMGLCALTCSAFALRLTCAPMRKWRILRVVIAIVAICGFTLVPYAVANILTANSLKIPVWIQHWALLSPLAILQHLNDARASVPIFPVMVAKYGKFSPVIVCSTFYFLTTLLLLLPPFLYSRLPRIGASPERR